MWIQRLQALIHPLNQQRLYFGELPDAFLAVASNNLQISIFNWAHRLIVLLRILGNFKS